MYILTEEKKKEKNHVNCHPGFCLERQDRVRKLNNLLTAVEVPGKVFKHGIVPVELLHG